MVDDQTLELIREKMDIVETIGHYVKLKKKGQNYVGLCPFHSEKTPSMMVSPAKSIWHCFGCGEGGNVFSFLMKVEHLSFPEVLEQCAEKTGVTIPKTTRQDPLKSKRNTFYAIMKTAHEHFVKGLKDAAVQSYLKKRNLSDEVVKYFQLGYSRSSLVPALSKIYEEKDLKNSGLFRGGTRGSLNDLFRKRLMFPIWDVNGRVIAFGGRQIEGDGPKYINSPETTFYTKGNHLYGLNLAKSQLSQQDYALIIVEGYMDVIGLYQAGITNVVAACGTALTDAQAKLASRFARTVYLCFDNDTAGRNATLRSIEAFRPLDIDVKVIDLSGAKDPDEWVQTQGVDSFRNQIKQALPVLRFQLHHLIESYRPLSEADQLDPEQKARILKEARALLQDQDEIIRQEYVQELIQLLKVDPETVKEGFYKYHIYSNRAKVMDTSTYRIDKYFNTETLALSVLLTSLQIRKECLSEFDEDLFHDMLNRRLFAVIKQSPSMSHEDLLNTIDKDLQKRLTEIVLKDDVVDPSRCAQESLKALQQRQFKLRIDVLKNEIKRLEKTGDFDKLKVHQRELSELKKKHR